MRTDSRYNFKIQAMPARNKGGLLENRDFAVLFDTINSLNGVQYAQRHLRVQALVDVPASSFSKEFKAHTTGKSLRYLNKYYKGENNTYRLRAVCFGLEQTAYTACLKSAGVSNTVRALVINQTKKTTYEPNNKPQIIPFFNNSLTAIDFPFLIDNGTERLHTVPVALLSAIPSDAGIELDMYNDTPFNFIPIIILPLTALEQLYKNQLVSEQANYAVPHIWLTIADNLYTETARTITEYLKTYEKVHKMHFKVYNDEIKNQENRNDGYKMTVIFAIILFVVFLLCVINAYSAITISMHNRKKEIAVALSVGLTQKKFKALCLQEALLHCVLPFIKALPFGILLLYWYAGRWIVFPFSALLTSINYWYLLLYVCTIVLSIFAMYLVNIKEYTGVPPAELVAQAL